MQTIIERLEEYAVTKSKEVVLYDELTPKGLTYEQLSLLTGQIYAYLKKNNIGKEDFVLINLPRGIQPIIAMIGVWKAGAAFAIVEDTYAPQRIEYIRNDCGCKIVLDKDAWQEFTQCEYLAGYEKTDEHDAAYAIYTSGTTGNPKGVLHEYGNLLRSVQSINYEGEKLLGTNDRGAILAPLNFVASIIGIIYVLYEGGCKLFIASYSTIKNPLRLKKMFLEKKITIIFLTPSYVRMIGSQTGPYLKKIVLGSEPANNLFIKNVDLYNFYAMSESGFIVSTFKLDKAYVSCPIGKPQFDLTVKIVDEDGNPVANGETGELCFENPYVRGYINLSEETEKSFRNEFYYTGDLAKTMPDGNIVLLGRSNDMVKINGNRIEPAEIEAAIRSILGIDWAAAKGFEGEKQSFLCAYYTADIEIDEDKLREEMLKRLPYYMIPAYYIKIDEIPMKANGKMDRKALPAPDISSFNSTYVAPENDIQKALCKAFEKVLGVEQVGIHDDFYEMGGDSLTSIEAIVESGLPGMEASFIFRGRNVENIAKMYSESHKNDDGQSPEMKDVEARKHTYRLTTEQLYMFDYQLYTPKSTMYNLFTMLKFDKEIYDLEKLAKAIKMVVMNHPALLTQFSFDEDGEIVQKYHPELIKDIKIENVTESDFQILKDDLVQPFKMIDSLLHRCRLFETEKAGYLFFDVHHTLFDGTSFKVFMKNMVNAYMGMPMEHDYYYLMLKKREDNISTDFYQESKEYFEKHYDGTDWVTHPIIDHESRDNECGELSSSLGITQEEISAIEKKFKVSRNEFFIAVLLIAISIQTKKSDVKQTWIYNGREDMQMLSSIGLIFRDLPVAAHFSDDMNVRDLYLSVHEQIEKGIEHCCYSYVENNAQVVEGDTSCLLYQKGIRDMTEDGLDIDTVDIRRNRAASQTILDVEILDGVDGLQIFLGYAASRYEDATMEMFKDLYVNIASILIHCDDADYITVGRIKKNLEALIYG